MIIFISPIYYEVDFIDLLYNFFYIALIKCSSNSKSLLFFTNVRYIFEESRYISMSLHSFLFLLLKLFCEFAYCDFYDSAEFWCALHESFFYKNFLTSMNSYSCLWSIKNFTISWYLCEVDKNIGYILWFVALLILLEDDDIKSSSLSYAGT